MVQESTRQVAQNGAMSRGAQCSETVAFFDGRIAIIAKRTPPRTPVATQTNTGRGAT